MNDSDMMERTLEAEDILGLFGGSAEPPSPAHPLPPPSSSNQRKNDDETVNPGDFSMLLNQLGASSSSSIPPPTNHRISVTPTPSPRLDPSFFSNKHSLPHHHKRSRETLNPNDLSFLKDLVSKSTSSAATEEEATSFSMPIVEDEEELTMNPNDDDDDEDGALMFTKASSVATPPQTPSSSNFLPTTSVIVPKSILRNNNTNKQQKRVQSVQFGRTKSVLRFDNQFPVSKLKQEDENEVQTPGKYLQMKEIREEEIVDDEDDEEEEPNKRLNFKEEEEDEFEKELFRNSWLQTEEEEKSFTGQEDATMAVPAIGDFAVQDNTTTFSQGTKASPPRLQARRNSALLEEEEEERDATLNVPSIAEFRARESLGNISEGDEGEEGEASISSRRQTLDVPSIMDFRRDSVDNTRRQTLDVPSFMDFRRESLATPTSSQLQSPISTSSSLQDTMPMFILHHGDDANSNRRQTLDVPSLMDFRRDSVDNNNTTRRATLDVPSILDFKRESVDATIAGEVTRRDTLDVPALMDFRRESTGDNRRETLDVPSILDFKRESAMEEEEDSLIAASANLPKFASPATAPQDKVAEFLGGGEETSSSSSSVDTVLTQLFPTFTPLLPAPAAAAPAEDFGTFQHDASPAAQPIFEALVNVHYTENCLDFVENQLYQVAVQRRAMLEQQQQQLPTTLMLTKQKKQVQCAREEAENELNQWQIQVLSEFLRSLQNQRQRVEQDTTQVLQVHQVKLDLRLRTAETELSAKQQQQIRDEEIAQLKSQLATAEQNQKQAEAALLDAETKLASRRKDMDVLRSKYETCATAELCLEQVEKQAEMAKLKLALQQSFSSWDLVRATANSAELAFGSFVLQVEVSERAVITVKIKEGVDTHVSDLLQKLPVANLYDLVHLLTLIEEHFAT